MQNIAIAATQRHVVCVVQDHRTPTADLGAQTAVPHHGIGV